MGMFTEGYVQETVEKTLSIDENYSGILGCFQIVSDAIHNEQVMFENLFALDYMDALNEADEESSKEKEPNAIKKIGVFIIKMIDLLKAKINSIIDSFISKLDAKKSKELKELAAKLPKDLSVDNEKLKSIFDKVKDETLIFPKDGVDKNAMFWVLDSREFLNDIEDDEDFENGKLDEFILFKVKLVILGSFSPDGDKSREFNINEFLKDIKDPCYIIDKTYKDLREIKKLGSKFLDIQKKDVSKYLIYNKDLNEDYIKFSKNMLSTIKSLQKAFPKVISTYMKCATKTYKIYLHTLQVITNSESTVELEESVKYDVDMDFDLL